MATLFTAEANLLLNFTLRGGTLVPAGTDYVAECSTNSSAAAHGTELSFSGYARQAVVANTSNWTAPSAQTIGNANTITVTASAPSTFTINGYWLTDAASGAGNDILYDNFGSPVSVAIGNAVQFNAAGLQVSAL
jgi:hypothetical protein